MWLRFIINIRRVVSFSTSLFLYSEYFPDLRLYTCYNYKLISIIFSFFNKWVIWRNRLCSLINFSIITHFFIYWNYRFSVCLGLLCHLDDACTSNPCHADAICDTSPINGSYTCSCASGYKGIDCSEDIDECEQGKFPWYNL